MQTSFLKNIDAYLGRFFCSLFRPHFPCQIVNATPATILIIRPGGIGDAVLLAPTIIQLKHNYHDATLTVLAERRNAGVIALIPAVDRVYCYDRPLEFLAALRGSYDVVIDTEQWHCLSAVVARLIRAPLKIGFATNERRRMFTHSVAYSHDDYEVDSFKRLQSLLGVRWFEYATPFLSVPDEARTATADRLLDTLGGRPFVAIFPGASVPERRWRAERFRQVAEIMSSRGYSVVVVGGGEDRPAGELIVASGGLNLAGQTSLAETAAILEQSKLLISGDSGILHIGVGLDIPTVSLFGPGRALKWAPRGDKHSVLNKQLSCSPCTTFGTTPSCPYSTRCMREITVDEVVEAALASLQNSGATKIDCP
jgi:lipopolysaccharide heptosyltransferase II